MDFATGVRALRQKMEVEVVKTSEPGGGFKVLLCRSVVERTVGWLMRHRRLVCDYETSEAGIEAFVLLALIRI